MVSTMTRLIVLQFATLCFAASGAHAIAEESHSEAPAALKPDPAVVKPQDGMLPRALVALSSTSPYALIVDKSQRTLTLWKWTGDKPVLVNAYPTDIGRNDGDKVAEGDRRTPEGVYFFQSTREKDDLDFNLYGVKAYVTDYPNYFDRLEKKTGTGIWLHAIPDTQSLWRGSKGCVVVRNKVIEELAPYITLKSTPMIVQSKVEYLSPEQWKFEREKIFSWLEKWREAWETKDLDNYMQYYDSQFTSNGMNKSRWRRYKAALTEKYTWIKVKLHEIQAFKHQGKFMIRFLQQYQSDQKEDFGEKYLYVEDRSSGLGIVGEEWKPQQEAHLAASAASSSTPSN